MVTPSGSDPLRLYSNFLIFNFSRVQTFLQAGAGFLHLAGGIDYHQPDIAGDNYLAAFCEQRCGGVFLPGATREGCEDIQRD